MAEAYKVLTTKALADATVVGLIADRFGPHPLPQKQKDVTQVPAVTYQRLANPRVRSDNATSNASAPVWRLLCWGSTYNEAMELAKAVRKALDGQAGIIAATTVKRIIYRPGGADILNPENGLRAVPQNYQIVLEEE